MTQKSEEATVTTEFAWLIEGDGNYWTGRSADRESFSTDISQAIRFFAKDDAEAVKHWLLEPFAFALRTTQHGFMTRVAAKAGG